MFKKILIFFGVFFIVLVILGVVGAILINSLSGASRRAEYSVPLSAPSPSLTQSLDEKGGGAEIEPFSSRLVIKKGSLSLVVKDIKETIEEISHYAKEKGGWVVSSAITEKEKTPSGTIIVRVPSENFEDAMTSFRNLGVRVAYEGSSGEDITEEYSDLKSQLRNLEAAETQLLEIMKKSGTIAEVLSVQKELINVRERIEMLKGRMQYLEQSVEMSAITVNLALSEELLPIPPSEKWRPQYVLRQAWRSLLATLKSLSYLLLWLVVYSVILVPAGLIIWKGVVFFRKKKKQN